MQLHPRKRWGRAPLREPPEGTWPCWLLVVKLLACRLWENFFCFKPVSCHHVLQQPQDPDTHPHTPLLCAHSPLCLHFWSLAEKLPARCHPPGPPMSYYGGPFPCDLQESSFSYTTLPLKCILESQPFPVSGGEFAQWQWELLNYCYLRTRPEAQNGRLLEHFSLWEHELALARLPVESWASPILTAWGPTCLSGAVKHMKGLVSSGLALSLWSKNRQVWARSLLPRKKTDFTSVSWGHKEPVSGQCQAS